MRRLRNYQSQLGIWVVCDVTDSKWQDMKLVRKAFQADYIYDIPVLFVA